MHVSRVEDGRPLHEANGESLGVGLAGGVYVARGECPTNTSEQLEQATLGLPSTPHPVGPARWDLVPI